MYSGRASSSVTSRNERLSIITTFMLSLRCIFRNSTASRTPQPAPTAAPSSIDAGILTIDINEISPPAQSPENTENITITKTSSSEAPARIICGISLSVPLFSSSSFSIFGTITAGETAASTAPIIAASVRESPSSGGASSVTPIISRLAGRKLISRAGLPHFFRSEISRFNPARVRIIIRAIFRSSGEMPISFGSSIPDIPSRIPAASIPVSFGSLSSPASSPSISPHISISAALSSIDFSSIFCK